MQSRGGHGRSVHSLVRTTSKCVLVDFNQPSTHHQSTACHQKMAVTWMGRDWMGRFGKIQEEFYRAYTVQYSLIIEDWMRWLRFDSWFMHHMKNDCRFMKIGVTVSACTWMVIAGMGLQDCRWIRPWWWSIYHTAVVHLNVERWFSWQLTIVTSDRKWVKQNSVTSCTPIHILL